MQRLTGPTGFVIAEAGVNHNGDPEVAHRLVDLAAECGADAIKFQTFDPHEIVVGGAEAAPYQRERGTSSSSQREMLRSLVLPESVWPELSRHAAERGLSFLSTAFDRRSADLLQGLGMEAFKVPSGELTNLPFITDLASRGLPLLISTGMADLPEIEAALAAAGAAPRLAIFHCVTAYPAPIHAANVKAIATLRDAFDLPVGWSDHTTGSMTAVMAVALGATFFEKHLTPDKALPGPDHLASAEPHEFRAYASDIRSAFAALGSGAKEPTAEELDMRLYARRSHHAARTLAAGTVLSEADTVVSRPADGVAPAAQIVGRRLRHDLPVAAPVKESDLD